MCFHELLRIATSPRIWTTVPTNLGTTGTILMEPTPMPSARLPSAVLVPAVQYGVGLVLFLFEPQYGLLVIGHHRVVRRLRPLTRGERLYVTACIAIHVTGVVHADRLYEGLWWYDDVTHALSGSLVAGLVVILLATKLDDPRQIAAGTLLAFVPIGIGWEMYEYRVLRLAVYGWGDAAVDFWNNILGGVAMVAYLGLRDRLAWKPTGDA